METAQAALWVVLILVIMAHHLVLRHFKQFVTCPDRWDHGGCQCQGGCGFVAHSRHPENHCVIFRAAPVGFFAWFNDDNAGFLDLSRLLSPQGDGGATRHASVVRWGVAGNIVWAWVLTIPAGAFVAAMAYWASLAVF